MKLDTQCWFRLNTSQALPICLMRGNFLAHKSDPDEFALWCRLWAISLVSSCPLIRSRRLGACCLFVHSISVAVQMEGRGTWQPQCRVVDPTWAITLLQWQRDINKKDNQSLQCFAGYMSATEKNPSAASDVFVSKRYGVLTSVMHQN